MKPIKSGGGIVTPTIVLDRDGTIIVDKHYLGDPNGVELESGAAVGLKRMSALGSRLVGITNQSGVSKGFFDLETVNAVNRRVDSLLFPHGVIIERWYVCPHGAADGCECRKPKPGLLLQAQRELELDPSAIFVIGDKISDLELADAVEGCGILVTTGKGGSLAPIARQRGYAVAENLVDAAIIIETRVSQAVTGG